MDKTLYTLKMGDNDVTLKFRMGTLRRLRDLLGGKDPWETARQKMSEVEAIDFAEKIVLAGAAANGYTTAAETISEWFDDLMPSDAGDIIKAFINAYVVPTPEGGKDTQQEPGADLGGNI